MRTLIRNNGDTLTYYNDLKHLHSSVSTYLSSTPTVAYHIQP